VKEKNKEFNERKTPPEILDHKLKEFFENS
jgi:hypothetical protein